MFRGRRDLDLVRFRHFGLDAPELEVVQDAAAQFQGRFHGLRVADGPDDEGSRQARLIDQNRRSHAADFAPARDALVVDGNGFGAGGAKFVDNAEQIFVVDDVQVLVFAGFDGLLAVIDREDDSLASF